RYWTFLSEELPAVVGSFFRVSDRREDTYVAGLSMGGYGALKWALRQPERFAAAASLSGALDLASLDLDDREPGMQRTLFGHREVSGTADDLLHLVASANAGTLPSLYVACGTEDHLIDDNHRFLDAARRADVPVTVDLRPGEHEWGFWDAQIQDVLAWLPLRAEPAR